MSNKEKQTKNKETIQKCLDELNEIEQFDIDEYDYLMDDNNDNKKYNNYDDFDEIKEVKPVKKEDPIKQVKHENKVVINKKKNKQRLSDKQIQENIKELDSREAANIDDDLDDIMKVF